MEGAVFVVCLLMAAELVGLQINRWRRKRAGVRRENAANILMRHNMQPVFYMATIGTSDPELRDALDEFARSGYIIVDDKGEVVGRLCEKTETDSHLKLVVSNS